MAGSTYNSHSDRLQSISRQNSEDFENEEGQENQGGEEENIYQPKKRRVMEQQIRRLARDKAKPSLLKFLRNNALSQKLLDSVSIGPGVHMDKGDIIWLVGTSLIFDAFKTVVLLLDVFFPLGTVLEKITIFPLACLTQYLMLKKRGVDFKGKVVRYFIAPKIVDFFPILDLVPTYTLSMILIISITKGEEALGLGKLSE